MLKQLWFSSVGNRIIFLIGIVLVLWFLLIWIILKCTIYVVGSFSSSSLFSVWRIVYWCNVLFVLLHLFTYIIFWLFLLTLCFKLHCFFSSIFKRFTNSSWAQHTILCLFITHRHMHLEQTICLLYLIFFCILIPT